MQRLMMQETLLILSILVMAGGVAAIFVRIGRREQAVDTIVDGQVVLFKKVDTLQVTATEIQLAGKDTDSRVAVLETTTENHDRRITEIVRRAR